ncbi:MAG: hypothetical protein DI629_20865 [Mesorhizobium amorphae]|nr:MAG: hypothetical protein DI629_20865 [Mesorhizobium amorphae]
MKRLLILAVPVALSACAAGVPATTARPATDSVIDVAMADTAAVINRSGVSPVAVRAPLTGAERERLRGVASGVEAPGAQAVRPSRSDPVGDMTVLPPEAVQPVSMNWNGPADELARQLAQRAGYSYDERGRRPANPPHIALYAAEEPLYGVARRAGAQLRSSGVLLIDPVARRVSLTWRG